MVFFRLTHQICVSLQLSVVAELKTLLNPLLCGIYHYQRAVVFCYMKVCNKCKEEKESSEFGNHKECKNGLSHLCKKCVSIKIKNNNRTKEGKLRLIYRSQKQRSKERGHKHPSYTKKEFIHRFKNDLDYLHYYYSWVISNYSKEYSPSFDRKDDYKGYSFDNIQIMYWFQNNKKMHLDKIKGVNNKQSKAVISTCVETGKTKEYYSISEADRQGFNKGRIWSCCQGKERQHLGYFWAYKI